MTSTNTATRRRVTRAMAVVIAIVALGSWSTSAHAQDVTTKESAAAVKAAYLADLETLRGKVVGLAEAFPADKYSWRPMDGVRSVAEVLMHIAGEDYGLVPTSFGGKAALAREEMTKLPTIADKAQVLDQLKKAFAYAKTEVDAADPAALIAKRRLFGQDRSILEIAMLLSGDSHEHLGQLIAYARTNRVVPPWSK